MRTRTSLSRALAAVTTAATFTLAACGGGGDGPTNPPPGGSGGFTISASPATATVQAGTSTTSAINISRTAPFTGAVEFSATTSNAGVTASFNPASATGGSSTLTISTASGLAAGSYTVTINGSGSGVSAQSTQIALTVTTTPPQPTNVTFAFCAARNPGWVAYQAGSGAWTRASGSGPSYTMPVGDRGGVAFVMSNASGGFDTKVFYGTNAELTAAGQAACTLTQIGSKSIQAPVTGIGGTDNAAVILSQGAGAVNGNAPPLIVLLQNVLDGPRDLFGVQRVPGTPRVPTKFILRRGINPANGSSLPTLDFSGTEAFAPASGDATITGLNGESAFVTSALLTTNGFVGSVPVDITDASASATQKIYGLPTAQLQTGDLHLATVFTTAAAQRTVARYFTTFGNQALTLGPVLSSVTLTNAATTPYVRPRAQFASQTEYNLGARAFFTQAAGGQSRAIEIVASPGYSSGLPANWSLELPDFSSAGGFNTTWAPVNGTQINGTATAYGGAFLNLGTPPANGTEYRSASRGGMF